MAAGKTLLMLAVGIPLLLGLNTLVRAARGLSPVWQDNPRYWSTLPLDGATVVVVVVGLWWWEWYQDRRRERRAIDLARELMHHRASAGPAA